jgi:hypothetical protein
MSLNHRYLWSTTFLKEQLRYRTLSEAAYFWYFIAVMAFDWIQFTLIAITPTPQISLSSIVSSWATFTITVLGLIYLYQKNGSDKGNQFFQRYFSLSVTVGWKFFITTYFISWFFQSVLNTTTTEILAWFQTVTLALLNMAMLWRIGFHLSSLRD